MQSCFTSTKYSDIQIDSGSSVRPNLASILVGSVQVISILIVGSLMDRFGRRILLLLSEAIVALSLLLLGLSLYWIENDPELSSQVGWLPLFSLILFVAAYSIGIGPIPWIYLEILPSSVIGKNSMHIIMKNIVRMEQIFLSATV